MLEGNQYKKFRIEGDAIHWKQKVFPIEDIAHLAYERLLTTQKMNLVKVGEAHSSNLTVTMQSGEKISLSFDESTIIVGLSLDKSTDLRNLDEAYLFLSKATFQQRISAYISQISKQGYFHYENFRFYPKDKIVTRGGKEFRLTESDFYRGPGFVEIRKQNPGIWDGILRGIVGPTRFYTETDLDVILALLKQYFGLTWG